jgi:hypothetical protein
MHYFGRIYFLATILLISCDNQQVVFETPQPEGRPNEKNIPVRLIGRYRSIKDSSILTITPRLLLRNKIVNISEPLSELDSSDRAQIKGDTAMSKKDWLFLWNIKVKGDSIFYRIDYRDTIYDASNGDVVRKFKGKYFLNHNNQSRGWSVMLLTPGKNTLNLGKISSPHDIQHLREITNSADTAYVFNPSKKEFKAFLKDDGFDDEDVFLKLN